MAWRRHSAALALPRSPLRAHSSLGVRTGAVQRQSRHRVRRRGPALARPQALAQAQAAARASSRASPTPSEHAARVYAALLSVPCGRVTTYGALAAAAGTCPRAAGRALRENPFAPQVACHRVVRADGALGGFRGSTQRASLAEKAALLRAEGIRVDAARGRVEDFASVFFAPARPAAALA